MNFSLESIYNWYRNTIRHPKYRWWLIGASLLYLLSPIDFLPDVFPIIGWIDDGVIATLLVAEVSQILLNRLKTGKNSNSTAAPTSAEATPDNTLEVKAVSMN